MKFRPTWAIVFILFVWNAQAEESKQKEAEQLKEVVVVGNLNEARNKIVPSLGGTTYTINSEQISEQSQGANASFNEVLLRAPGVTQDSFGQIHVRNEHGDLQYRINDVLLPEGISGFGQELDTHFADSVTLITGSLPAQYGFRTSGIVDIHTKSGAFNEGGNVSAYGGSFNTVNPTFQVGGASGDFNYYLVGNYLQDSLGIENPTSSYNAIHDATKQYKGFGYFSYLIDDTSRLNFMLSASVNHFHIPNTPDLATSFTLTGVPTFNSVDLNETQNEQNYYGIAAYQKSFDKFNFQLSAFSRLSGIKFKPDQNGDLMFNGVASHVNQNIFENGLEFDSSANLGEKHTLRSGMLLSIQRAKTDSTTDVFPTDASGAQSSSDPFPIVQNTQKVGYMYGVYVQDEWKIVKPLVINFGVRFDGVNTYVNEFQASPRINITYTPVKSTSLHIGYSRYFTPPPLELINTESVQQFNGTTNASEVTQNSPVQSERSNYFDAGVTHEFLPGLQMGLDGYYKLAKNQLDEGQFGQALIFSPFNYHYGRIYGVEFTSTLEKKGFSAYGNVAFSKAQGKQIDSAQFLFSQAELDYINDNYVYLDHDQRITASVGLAYHFLSSIVYADLLVGTGLRTGFANTEQLPAYAPLNIGASHNFKVDAGDLRGIQLRFDIVNLFDEVYQLRNGEGIGVGAPQYGQRRGFFGGLTLAFGAPNEKEKFKTETQPIGR